MVLEPKISLTGVQAGEACWNNSLLTMFKQQSFFHIVVCHFLMILFRSHVHLISEIKLRLR